MKRRLSLMISTTLVVCLAGCVTTGTQSQQQAPATEEQQVAAALGKIGDATALAVNAQRELAMTADAKTSRETLLRQRLMTDMVDYDFYGDVEDLLSEIAMIYSYDFAVYGKRPPEHLNVNVFIKNKPVVEVLKQIGYQSTKQLDVKLTKTSIELHYKQQPER